ncbi:MAG TPA: FkbM family methyltransferase [Verrucomicrobiota bacterium]|nr:FkbM family methyltransferase [Verrucomicrobiota bacterium]
MNILDLGANVGFFSARVAHVLLTRGVKSFQITCIEGSPTVYSELKRRIQASPPLAERTKLVQGLVGLRQGTAAIADSPFHPMTSIFSPASDGVSVAYVDLDRVVDPNSPIDLVKCDIEGAEQQFLETYPQLLERTHLAIFEFHHDKCDTARCRELLSRSGLVHKQTIVDGPYTALQFFAREA